MSAEGEEIIWKPCVGDATGWGLEVSSNGFARKTTLLKRGPKTRPLKLRLSAGGYLKFNVTRPVGTPQSRTENMMVHILVAEAFIGLRPVGKFVNHIDGNRLNNAASNLEWVTPSENQQHAAALRPKHRYKRFSDAEIRTMRKLPKLGLSLSQICNAYGRGLQPFELSRILNGTRRVGAYLSMKHTLHPKKALAPDRAAYIVAQA